MNILLMVVLSTKLLIQIPQVLADHKDPTVRTNINKVDPMFENSISNYKDLQQSLETNKNSVIEGVKNKVGFNNIEGNERAENKAKELSNIEAHDLEARGRGEYAKHPEMNDYFVDYSKPSHSLYRSDAEKIADASGKMMFDLVGLLKELSVDCKTQKGNKQVEPEYFIKIEKKLAAKQDTVYDKFVCEQLRNKYSCSNVLTVTCKKKGMKWDHWQERTIDLIGCNVYAYSRNWTYDIHWKKSRYGVHMKVGDAEVNRQIQRHIASTIHTGIDNIGDVRTNARGFGGEPAQAALGGEHYYWPRYLVHYKYRDGQLVCEEWDNNWTEICQLD